ncbi:MAG: OmpH family outer membrane protein [bacterium]|nr:OmpH family outer membrane protein [bacterium]
MRIWSLVLAFVLGTVAVDLMAQGNAAATQSSQISVAVVDVGHILKNHPTMKADLERIEGDMKQADEEMTRQRDSILKLMEQLREKFTEGTPEYEREEKRIAEMDTQFRLEIVKKRKEFDKARATVLYQIYSDIKGLVKYASEQMGIQVVMRVNGTREDLDPAKPDTVQLLMSQEVIHYTPKVDLTDWVLNGLKQRTAQQQSAGTTR